MTIITVRAGVMAVDSLITAGGTIVGQCKKWGKVPEHMGGGFIAGSGDSAGVSQALADIDKYNFDLIGRDSNEKYTLVALRGDGSVMINETGTWFGYDAEYYAEGSGAQLALGAMAQGATAYEAAQIACRLSTSCGGEVHVFGLEEARGDSVQYSSSIGVEAPSEDLLSRFRATDFDSNMA